MWEGAAIILIAAGALLWADRTEGITDASITLRLARPLTRSCSSTTAPMLHVEVGWNTVSPISRT